MKTDFEHWLSAQFGETGPFTLFIVLVRIAGDRSFLKSSYAHLIGDDMDWRGVRPARPGRSWDGVAFFVGLDHAGGPLPDAAAARKLGEVEADVKADPLVLNRGRFFDREGGICASTRSRDDRGPRSVVRRGA